MNWERLADRYVRRRMKALGMSPDLKKEDEDANTLMGDKDGATEPEADNSPVSDAKISDKDLFYHWNGGLGTK